MQTDATMLSELLQQYGPMGLAFGGVLALTLQQRKRIENLEKQQQEDHVQHLADQKEMINEYVELVKNKTRVLADLTGCLNAIKGTIERIERKGP